jgi:hypothetical protein
MRDSKHRIFVALDIVPRAIVAPATVTRRAVWVVFMTFGPGSTMRCDDTDWRSGKVVLSSGWNMLEKDQSNWINSVSGHLSVISTLAQLQTQMEMEHNLCRRQSHSASWRWTSCQGRSWRLRP